MEFFLSVVIKRWLIQYYMVFIHYFLYCVRKKSFIII